MKKEIRDNTVVQKNGDIGSIEISGADYTSFSRFLMSANRGDMVIIKSLSSVCSSLHELFRITSIANKRGISIKSVAETWYDTSKSQSVSKLINELESFYHGCMTSSTKIGIERARRMGKQIGRKIGSVVISESKLHRIYNEYMAGTVSVQKLCDNHQISVSTFYRYIRDNNLDRRQL